MDNIGHSIPNSLRPDDIPENGYGSYIIQSAVDHIQRLYSYRRVADYPLFASVGLGYDEGLASWRANAKMMLALAAVVTLLLGGLTLYLTREIDRRTMRDIELANERSKLQDAIECISEAFIIWDKDDRFVLCNEAYRQLYPQSAQFLQPGLSFEELLRHNLACGEYQNAVGREEQWFTEHTHLHQQASDVLELPLSNGRRVLITNRRMKSGGIAGLRIDITSLVQTREDLKKALAKAEAVNVAKTLFLANMSHEFRTPLNAIIGFSQIIRDQIMGPVGKTAYIDYAKDVCDAGEHLLEIINNVLDASRVEVNKFDLKEETVEIGELVQSAIQTVRVQAGKKSIALEQRLPEEPVGLRADTLRLRQVLINLLANAVKFTPEGGRVTLSFEASPAAAVFAVADTGIGMSPDEIAVATEPFRQIENALVKRHEGIGLGLSLAKHMTEMHSGTLEIISEKGVGTTVRVVLPPELILHAPKASAAA
jgi:signal transduction histidine kinase